MDKRLKCCLCGRNIEPEPKTGWKYGNNAEPLKEGICCNWCNNNLVVPLRIRKMMG